AGTSQVKPGHDDGGFSNQLSNRHTSTFPRRDAPEFCCWLCHLKHQRAQGMPGARCARSLACKIKKHTSIVTTVTPDTPGIPRAMVLMVSFVISPVIGLVCHRRNRSCLRSLDASVEASGPHDFAVRVSTVRTRCLRVHRIPSRVRDDREPRICG